jgi:hypothetical protein
LAKIRQQLAADAEIPFRVPIQSASFLLGNIGNNVGHLSAEVTYIVPPDGTG